MMAVSGYFTLPTNLCCLASSLLKNEVRSKRIGLNMSKKD